MFNKGTLVSKTYEKRDDGYVRVCTYECVLTEEELLEFKTQEEAKKAAAEAYDKQVTIDAADAEITKIDNALA